MTMTWSLVPGSRRGLVLLTAAALASPSAAAEPVAPQPLGNPGDWATSDDYPASALRADVEGVVRFVLGVASDGTVTDCSVSESSGDPGLDSKTCELMRARARFEPARNDAGQPTTGTWASSVRWQIPDGGARLPDPQTISYRVVVEKDGKVSACEVLSDDQTGVAMKSCEAISAQKFEPVLNSSGAAIRTATVMTFKTERTELPD